MINVTFYITVKEKFIKHVIREIKERATKIARNITFVIQIKKVQTKLPRNSNEINYNKNLTLFTKPIT